MPRALLIAAVVCVTAFSVFSQTRPRAGATPELKNDKISRTYAHVYDNYFGAGNSIYQPGIQ